MAFLFLATCARRNSIFDTTDTRTDLIMSKTATVLDVAKQLNDEVLAPMKTVFVGKDEVIDLLGVCLVARENLFLLGPPGTAKSALVQTLARRMQGTVFDYLLTQFTEPNEIFGPFDIRQLREGNLVTNTEGMLPEASFVFLDELLNANSAILNSLLMVLNERVFRRGRETRSLPTLLLVGASNGLPEDDALRALFDRFPLRVQCDNVPEEQLTGVMRAGWKLDQPAERPQASVSVDEIKQLQAAITAAELEGVLEDFVALVLRLRNAGVAISDRRAVKLQRLIAASALLCGRLTVHVSDFWVLRYVWDNVEQQSVVDTIVQTFVDEHTSTAENTIVRHPRSSETVPDPDQLAADLDLIIESAGGELSTADRVKLTDRLSVLAARCAWVAEEQQRKHLEGKVQAAWDQLA